MSTDTLQELADEYQRIITVEEHDRPALYERITEMMESGQANGAEIARALGVQRQRIYQIVKEQKEKAQ